MFSAHIFEEEVKVTRSELVELLMNAREACFTAFFHKKVNDDYVKSILSKMNASELKSNINEVTKQLYQGKFHEIQCFLAGTEAKLGRSCVIDLTQPQGQGFRLIDHRSLEAIILKNKKYIVKN
jgi:hypothetical protein